MHAGCAGTAPSRLDFRAAHSLLERSMAQNKVEQHHVTHGGRDFHFVSYEAQPANEKRKEAAVPSMWYLMGPARRWPVMPHDPGQSELEVVRALTAWLTLQGLLPGR